MAQETVSAKRTNGEAVEVRFDFGDNLQDAVAKFGDEIAWNHLRGSMRVALQGYIRSQMDQGKTPAEIQTLVDSWKPGQRRTSVPKAEKLRKQLDQLSPEERAELLKAYKAQAKAAA